MFLSCARGSHEVFVDGKLFNNHSITGDLNQNISTAIPSNAQVIAVKVTNPGGSTGWKGALSDGSVVTDGSWRCTSTYADGWQNVNFNDSKWPVPYMTGVTQGCVGYLPSAQWLWTEKSYSAATSIYCRKKLGMEIADNHVTKINLH